MNIYSSVDGSNIDKIVALFNSVLINANKERQNELKFYLLVDKFPDSIPKIPIELESKLLMKELNLTPNWVKTLEEFNNVFYKKSSWCKNNMNFARFLIFTHFPEVDRVVYLDWDMIMLADIFELEEKYKCYNDMIVANCGTQTLYSNIFVPEFRFATNFKMLYARSPLERLKYHRCNVIFKYIGIELESVFNDGFNAGFYIVSKNHFEENFMLELLRKLIKAQTKFGCFNFGTQVVMNLMHLNNRQFVEKEWNHLPNIEDLHSLKNIHWNGNKKPWNSRSDNNKIWIEYYLKVYPEKENQFNYNYVIKEDYSSKVTIKKNKVKDMNLLRFISSRNK